MSDKVMYQWIKGDRLGTVCTVDSDKSNNKFIYFEDGTRILRNVVQEFLMEVFDESEVLQFTTPENSSPIQTGPIQDQTTIVATDASTPIVNQTTSVMGKMIEKMSKKNVVQIPININVNIPTPSIYAMLSEGMEEEDLNDEIIQSALNQIDINNLQEYVKENVSNFLSNYYSN